MQCTNKECRNATIFLLHCGSLCCCIMLQWPLICLVAVALQPTFLLWLCITMLFFFFAVWNLLASQQFFFVFQQVFLLHNTTFCLIQEECHSTKPKRKHHNTKCCTAKWMGGLLQCKATVLVAVKWKHCFASWHVSLFMYWVVLVGFALLHHSLFCLWCSTLFWNAALFVSVILHCNSFFLQCGALFSGLNMALFLQCSAVSFANMHSFFLFFTALSVLCHVVPLFLFVALYHRTFCFLPLLFCSEELCFFVSRCMALSLLHCILCFYYTQLSVFLCYIVLLFLFMHWAFCFCHAVLFDFLPHSFLWFRDLFLHCIAWLSLFVWQLFNQNNANSKSAKQRHKMGWTMCWSWSVRTEEKCTRNSTSGSPGGSWWTKFHRGVHP